MVIKTQTDYTKYYPKISKLKKFNKKKTKHKKKRIECVKKKNKNTRKSPLKLELTLYIT